MRKAGGGFSLIEIIITVTVLGIVAAIAVPSFSTWLNKQRADIEAEQVTGLLQRARMRAVGTASVVRVDIQVPGSAQMLARSQPGAALTVQDSITLSQGLEFVEPLPYTAMFFQPNGMVTETEGDPDDLITTDYYQVEDVNRNYTVQFRVWSSGIVQFCGDITDPSHGGCQ
jgi:prepilin-type N-terminal cleavage/methylation domain-containing protein